MLDEQTQKELLNSIIECFYKDKQIADKYKKSAEEYNKEIKDIMADIKIDEFETDNGLIAKLTHKQLESFNEEKLLAKIKELNIPGIIKTREYVDMEALENAIYNENIDASELSTCREVKETIALKVTKKKEK